MSNRLYVKLMLFEWKLSKLFHSPSSNPIDAIFSFDIEFKLAKWCHYDRVIIGGEIVRARAEITITKHYDTLIGTNKENKCFEYTVYKLYNLHSACIKC